MDLEHTIIENIKRIRKQKKISQEKLAEFCNTSTSYIGHIETFKNVPTLSTIDKIAKALNVPPVLLFIDNDADKLIPDEIQKSHLVKRIKMQIISDLEKSLDNILKQI